MAATRSTAWAMVALLLGGAASVAARSARQHGEGELGRAQARYARVDAARRSQGARLDALFAAASVAYPAPLLLRAFKEEGLLELWAARQEDGRFVLVKAYPFTGYSGDLGPKRRRWDRQIPEGFYRVSAFNGASRYHLSFKIDYPNASDRVLSDRRHPGDHIFIHGDEVTDGCIPIGDRAISQLYLAVLDSRDAGHEVPVHIFPCRFSEPSCARLLRSASARRPRLAEFWASLRAGFEAFDRDLVPPLIEVAEDGRYHVR